LSREAQTYARSYAWHKIVDRMLAVYSDLHLERFEPTL
jgi:hypothetical protein